MLTAGPAATPAQTPAATPAPNTAPPPAAKPTPLGMDAAVQLLSALSTPTGPKTEATPTDPPPAQELPAAETPAETPPKQEPPPSRAAEFAKQARKERALLDQQRALKAQEEQLKATRAEIDKMKADLDARMKSMGETEGERKVRRAEYLKNPALFLKDAGLTLEQLAEAVLRDGQPDPAQLAQTVEEKLAQTTATIEEKIAALKKAQDDKDAAEKAEREAAAKQEEEEAKAQVRSDIAETVKAEPEKYELIGYFGKDAQDLVYKAIEAHYEETGEVLPYATACDKVEEYLDKRVEGISKTKRWGPRIKPREAATPPPAPKPAAAPAASLGNLGAPPTPPARKYVSEEERYNAAVAALQGAKF